MARTVVAVATGNGFTVGDLRILERTRAWSAPEAVPEHRLVFVRRGLFRLRLPGWRGLVDPLVAYLNTPGAEQCIAHRPDVEDACTVVTLAGRLAEDLLPTSAPTRPLVTGGRVDLAQRVLLARARQGADEFELLDRVCRLTEQLTVPERVLGRSLPSHRRLAEQARELLAADPAWPTLDDLARALGVSRPHLSRVFRSVTGETLTRCRNRLRVRAALDRLEAGAANLAALAAELGFADHAHLTRTLRAEVDQPPSRVRDLLRGGRD